MTRFVNKLQTGLLAFSLALVPVGVLAVSASDAVCKNINPNGNNPGVDSTCSQAQNHFVGPHGLLTVGMNWLFWLVGIIALVMLIWGGFRYVISAGNPETTKKAGQSILNAVYGIAIAIGGQIIVKFVLAKL